MHEYLPNQKEKKSKKAEEKNMLTIIIRNLFAYQIGNFKKWSVWMGWIWGQGFGFESPNPNSLFG
jgi:hypothetical protein